MNLWKEWTSRRHTQERLAVLRPRRTYTYEEVQRFTALCDGLVVNGLQIARIIVGETSRWFHAEVVYDDGTENAPYENWYFYKKPETESSDAAWTTLRQLHAGEVFKTRDGIAAVKSEYHLPNGHCECILLASGEYADFPEGNDTVVQIVSLPEGA